MANEDEPLSAGIGSALLQGQAAGQELAQKAFNLEHARNQAEQQQQAVKAAKLQSFFTDINKVITTPKGKVRDIMRERAKAKAAATGLIVDPLFYEHLNNEDLYVPLAKTMADFAGLQTTEEKATAMDEAAVFLTDADAMEQGLMKMNMGLQEQAMEAANQRDKKTADVPKQLDELVKEWSSQTGNNPTGTTRELSGYYDSLQTAGGIDIATEEGKDLLNRFKVKGAKTNTTSGAKDLMIIFSYMKMLDPRSVVREGEQEAVGNLSSIPDWLVKRLNKAMAGELLPGSVRQDILVAARDKMIAQEKTQDNYNKLFLSRATQLGIPEERARTFFDISETGKKARSMLVKDQKKQGMNRKLFEQAQKAGMTPEQFTQALEAETLKAKSDLLPAKGR